MTEQEEKERRHQVYKAIQTACAGYPVKSVIPAILDTFAGLMAFTYPTQEEAFRAFGVYMEDCKAAMITNWESAKMIRKLADELQAMGKPNQ